MTKVGLLEVYSLDSPLTGLQRVLYRLCEMIIVMVYRMVIRYHLNQGSDTTRNVKSRQSKGNFNPYQQTTGLPKGPKIYGNRGIVVPRIVGRVPGRGVRNIASVAGSSSTVSTDSVSKIRKIAELCMKNPNFIVKDKLYRLIFDPRLFEVAYHKLTSKPGSMTPGINPQTLDGMSSEVVEGIIQELMDGTFKFKPGRRVNIPKPNGGSRPLTIAPPRDKLVQEVIRMILEAIYESGFSSSSHGFRPNRSCHSALKDVKSKFQSAG
jgi:hypothetical protein